MEGRSHHFIALIDELARMRGRSASVFRTIRQSYGLTELENVVLSAVVGAPTPPTVPQIGRSLGHPRQMIQRAADSLAARGLVTTRDNVDHKRARLLVPTPAGRQMQNDADAQGLALAAKMTEGLDVGQIFDTVAGLRRIREKIEENIRNTGTENAGEE